MHEESQAILDAALKLPDDERLWLVSRLMEMTPDGAGGLHLDDEDLLEELDRRFEDREGAMPWSELRKEL